MANRGAPPGNKNASNAKEWKDAIRYALAKKGANEDGDEHAHIRGLRVVAKKFVDACASGDAWAMKELGDRWDGKPPQAIQHSGDSENPLVVEKIERVILNGDAADKDS